MYPKIDMRLREHNQAISSVRADNRRSCKLHNSFIHTNPSTGHKIKAHSIYVHKVLTMYNQGATATARHGRDVHAKKEFCREESLSKHDQHLEELGCRRT